MANRGQLTETLVRKIEMLHQEQFTTAKSTTILRLIPYVYDCAINDRNIDPAKINAEEREIMSYWRRHKWMSGGASERVALSAQFADFCHSVLYRAYIDYENREVGFVLDDKDRP